jgi:hypothetical protein
MTDGPMTDELMQDEGTVLKGLAICWGCNILHLIAGWILMFAVTRVGMVVFGGIGLVQLVYVIPFWRHFKSEGQANIVNGLVIAASVTALLNVGCWTQFYRFFR